MARAGTAWSPNPKGCGNTLPPNFEIQGTLGAGMRRFPLLHTNAGNGFCSRSLCKAESDIYLSTHLKTTTSYKAGVILVKMRHQRPEPFEVSALLGTILGSVWPEAGKWKKHVVNCCSDPPFHARRGPI